MHHSMVGAIACIWHSEGTFSSKVKDKGDTINIEIADGQFKVKRLVDDIESACCIIVIQ